ncbi:MAG TPA: ABC transporter ATP-binding protein [Cyclobacteriaceae bacterium]|nr:ABC transporter ATP-binding protein [Cyclobacteriaceae bacterium]
MEFIRLDNLSKIYARGNQRIHAIDNLSLEIEEGIILSVVGRSGSGKSTLLNLIGGLDRPTDGKIIFKGKDIGSLSKNEQAYHRRRNVGMIFQSFNLIYSYSAYENIMLALIFGGVPKRLRNQRAMELLKNVGLEGRISHKPDELSGGEAQRVAIARAMANNPEVLLADEPTGNLDSITANEIIGLLVEANRGKKKSVIMITHDIDLAHRVSDRIVRLLDGKIAEDYLVKR